jgi:transposase
VDAQSVHESAEGVVPSATSGYDSHKNVNGRKRHVLADTLGLLIGVVVTPASAQDRVGAAMLLKRARARGRRLALVWADRAYEGDWRHWAARELGVTIEVVYRNPEDAGHGSRSSLPLGHRAHPRLDHPQATLRPRLRAPPRPPRRHGPVGRHPPDDPPRGKAPKTAPAPA